jgi:hypothetical protein
MTDLSRIPLPQLALQTLALLPVAPTVRTLGAALALGPGPIADLVRKLERAGAIECWDTVEGTRALLSARSLRQLGLRPSSDGKRWQRPAR